VNALKQLHEHGQSYWLDNLTRDMITGGELERRVREAGLRGVTSNPAIFHKAISGGTEYDEQIRDLALQGLGPGEIYERLTVADIRDACDILRPVYDSSGGADGFVSLEVSPYLVHDTEATMKEARRLFGEVDRPNVLIKIPGSEAGVPAIEQMLFEGVNVNITLLFSISSYEAVAEAYLRALERRAEDGKDLGSVASVASFFLSRIDVLVDQLLGQRIRAAVGTDNGTRAERLLGEAAVANAKLAYRRFEKLFSGDRWRPLEDKGARVQRVLWASTSTKNPLYSDVRYVEPLIGRDTVNTLPEATIDAFADHGVVRADTVTAGLEEAEQVMRKLADLDIDFDAVTWQLLNEGMDKFVDPFNHLMATIQEQRQEICGAHVAKQRAAGADGRLGDVLDALGERRFAQRLHGRDPSLWADAPDTMEKVGERLGWLDCVNEFSARTAELAAFAGEVAAAGIRSVVLVGMGGSSLCAEVCGKIFGPAEGYPALFVLDSTDPAAIDRIEDSVELEHTLFVVSSKSGTTTETLSFYHYFFEKVRAAGIAEPGERFVAITDPGSPLGEEAKSRGFRHVFLNPEDIGGRYSALSYFGLVPMALLGMDLERLLGRARGQLVSCGPEVPPGSNPGVALGAVLGASARAGRDKVTLFADEPLAPSADWLEQLLAESTGKDGRGLVPVVGEPPGEPSAYGGDRIFVASMRGSDSGLDGLMDALEADGHPVVRIALDDPYDLGAEFVRWEVATATAGAVLRVNPFDEPNVTESKKKTRELLEFWDEHGGFDEGEPTVREGDVAVWWGDQSSPDTDVAGVVKKLLGELCEGDYLALLAYFERTEARHRILQSLRTSIRDRWSVATTLGYGPRYLHSTGQLHKGGPDTGVYLVLTTDPGGDQPIPGSDHGFATLLRAQALGDYRALADHDRRVARLHLAGEPERALERLIDELAARGED